MVQKPASLQPCEKDKRGRRKVGSNRRVSFILYLPAIKIPKKTNHMPKRTRMRIPLFICFFMIAAFASGQDRFEWSEEYDLTMADFLGSGTQIGGGNIYTVQTASQIDFAWQMTNFEFMATKNW